MQYVNYKRNELKQIPVSLFEEGLPNLKNVEKTSTIANWLMQRIDLELEKKSISPESLLPTKAEMAYLFGVSLGTIQNVMRMLEDKNYIYSKQCIGSVIKDRSNSETFIRKRTSKKDIAENKIKNYIISNNLAIGAKLPVSRQLAKELDMTLNTTRNAILMLITQNILQYNEKKQLVVLQNSFDISNYDEESLVLKVKDDLKDYICAEFKMGDRLPSHNALSQKFNVSVKTIHNAIQILVKENMLLSRRGAYGTVVINTSKNSAVEPRREMSIFAPACDTAFYHYEKIKNKIKTMIISDFSIGSKLPSIREMSKILDVNTNTIRRSLNALEKDGIVRFSRGRYGGTYVIDLPNPEEQTFRWLAVNPQYSKVLS